MTPDLAHIAAFALGSATGMAFHIHRLRAERRHAARAMQMAFEASAVSPRASVPLSPPDPVRSAAGRKGAAVTNARRASAAERHRQRVLEVAEQMRQDIAAKAALHHADQVPLDFTPPQGIIQP